MKDPKRLYEDESNRVGALLLRGGRADVPDRARIRRIVAGVIGAGGALASGTAGATAVSLSTVAQWFVAGAMAGVVATSTAYTFDRPEQRTTEQRSAAPMPRTAPSTIAPVHQAVLVGSAIPPQPVRVRARHQRQEPIASAPLPKPDELSGGGDAAAPVSTLAAEASALASAKAALDRNAAGEAIVALRAYRARFAHGALDQDARYLEMEAELASGNRAAAQQLAAGLAAGASPNAQRARDVLKGDQP